MRRCLRPLIAGALAASVVASWVGFRILRPHAPAARRDPERLELARSELDADASPRIVGTAHAAAASRGWCARLTSANAQAINAHLTADAGCASPELDCVVDKTGAGWGFEVQSVQAKLEYGSCTTVTEVGVARSDGSSIIHSQGGGGLTLTESAGADFQWGLESGHIRPLGDYDGDGDQEVLVTREWWAHEGGRGVDSSVWTLSHGALVHYAPAAGFVIQDVEDADHDGKLDLITRGPYEQIEAWSAVGFHYPYGPAIFLAHALPSGAFSTTDAVAVAFAKRKCSAPIEDNVAMACARLRGKSESAVLAEKRQGGCADFLEDPARYPESCPTWMPALAAVSPPFPF